MKSGISVGGLLKSSGFRAGPPGSQLPAQVSAPDLPDEHCNQGRGGSSRGGGSGRGQGPGVRRKWVQQKRGRVQRPGTSGFRVVGRGQG